MEELPSEAEAGDQQESHASANQKVQSATVHFTSLAASLPITPRGGFLGISPLYRHADGWHGYMRPLVGAMVANECFAARPSDVIVATQPKSGTTWIKALLYATAHRTEHPVESPAHPFHSMSPHECIKFFEIQLYGGEEAPDLDVLPDPRLFATHIPYASLPRTAAAAGCKIVYVCREPKDTLVSMWHFVNRNRARLGHEPFSPEAAAELFCTGATPFGPYWGHVLGYWRAHLAHPGEVLFLRYEEMARDTAATVRRLAAFLGLPFSAEEEGRGAVDAVVRLCAFEHMSGLEATRTGTTRFTNGAAFPNSHFFRRGVVGDWANHLSPELARRVDAVAEAEFRGSGLRF